MSLQEQGIPGNNSPEEMSDERKEQLIAPFRRVLEHPHSQRALAALKGDTLRLSFIALNGGPEDVSGADSFTELAVLQEEGFFAAQCYGDVDDTTVEWHLINQTKSGRVARQMTRPIGSRLTTDSIPFYACTIRESAAYIISQQAHCEYKGILTELGMSDRERIQIVYDGNDVVEVTVLPITLGRVG